MIGTNIEVQVPSVEKQYVIRGLWSGAFTVTVKISGSATSIVMNTGDIRMVYTNGIDIYDTAPPTDLTPVLLKADNLASVADAPTSRTNLGLGDLATKNAGVGLTVSGSSVLGGVVGEIKMWPAVAAPATWSLCDGTALDRTTFATLFAIVGTTYGIGDGSTTFNLPDFRGRSPVGAGIGNTAEGGGAGTSRALADNVGAETHTLIETEFEHKHETPSTSGGAGSTFGQVIVNTAWPHGVSGSTRKFNFHGGLGATTPTVSTLNSGPVNTLVATPHNNMSPGLGVNFIIFTGV